MTWCLKAENVLSRARGTRMDMEFVGAMRVHSRQGIGSVLVTLERGGEGRGACRIGVRKLVGALAFSAGF